MISWGILKYIVSGEVVMLFLLLFHNYTTKLVTFSWSISNYHNNSFHACTLYEEKSVWHVHMSFSSLCYNSGTCLVENHFVIVLRTMISWWIFICPGNKMEKCISHYLYLSKVVWQCHYILQMHSYHLLSCCLTYQQHEDGKHHTVHLVCPMKMETKSTTDSPAVVSCFTS